MKINPNLIKITPKHMPFAFCVYGEPTDEISKWLEYCGIKTEHTQIRKIADFTFVILSPEGMRGIFNNLKIIFLG